MHVNIFALKVVLLLYNMKEKRSVIGVEIALNIFREISNVVGEKIEIVLQFV